MTKKVKLIILFLGFLGIMMVANFVWAADFGVTNVNTGLNGVLTSTDPRILIGRIIQIALGFLGVIAVVIVMYAGSLWMTSDGDEEKITKAKNILKNAVIGLAIVLSAWGITTFILTRLAGAINGNNGASDTQPYSGGFSNSGVGAIGACTVASTYPENNQGDVARNTSIMITFKEKIKLDTVCVDGAGISCACSATCNKINPAAVRLFKIDLGDACSAISCPSVNSNETEVIANVSSDNKTLMLTPLNYLGSSDGDTPYAVKFTNVIKKLDNSSMFSACGSDLASWTFIVNNKVDLTPPIVSPVSMSPLPDNLQDIFSSPTPAKAAVGSLTIKSKPQIYAAAQILSLTPAGANAFLDYHGTITEFKISVPVADKAQLFDVNDNPLGAVDFDSNGQAVFPDFMTFTAVNHPIGSLWDIKISPEKLADNLVIDSDTYVFASTSTNNNILVPTPFTAAALAANIIKSKINSDSPIVVSNDSGSAIVNVAAKVSGKNGNNIIITTTNPGSISINPLNGGVNQIELSKSQGQADRPMNSVIQLNFNEAVNPLLVSGSADEVSSTIKVVNSNASSSVNGTTCSSNSQCQSYKCVENACVGDYLGGNFMISNAYKTVEFVSDQECGVNGCGEKIYCLPPNSHLEVKLVAADLKTCTSNEDCLAKTPFNICADTPLGYKTCQNAEGQNYPTADLNKLNGVVDAALNSLDGDRNINAEGPINFYNDNYSSSALENINKKDNYAWSFYISDKLNLIPPYITNIIPSQNTTKTSLLDPISIVFNEVMMNSTLKTGSVNVDNGSVITEHHLISLKSLSTTPLGYWISADNRDVPPLDGFPDITIAQITHSPLVESATFKAQVGSGVKDIYQNCYKPSAGPLCTVTEDNPSCCFGEATSTLGTDGNCK